MRSSDSLRHWIWWAPGGVLEDWTLWRRDRVRDLSRFARAFADLSHADNEDLPRDREDAMLDVATVPVRGPTGVPSLWKRIPNEADRVTTARLLFSLALRDDLVNVPAESPDPKTRARWMQLQLEEPVDAGDESPKPKTRGELLDLTVGISEARNHGHAPGTLAAAMLLYLPNPRYAPELMAALSEERAVEVRALCVESPQHYEVCRREPWLAAVILLMFDRLTSALPQLLETPTQGGQSTAAQGG